MNNLKGQKKDDENGKGVELEEQPEGNKEALEAEAEQGYKASQEAMEAADSLSVIFLLLRFNFMQLFS